MPFFFVKPELQRIQNFKIILLTFQAISGLKINMDKSELIISRESESLTQQLSDVLGCKKGTFPIIYLGLPLSDKRLPKVAYLPLLKKISARLSGWAAKFLSMAARIVLINAVLSALRKIGSGLTIGFWIHDWGLGILKYQYSILFTFALDQNATVASIASQNSFYQLFHATLSVQASDQLNELVSRMSLLLTTHENARDDVVWKGNNSDIFSVKSDYFTLKNGPRIDTNVYNIWKLNVPPRFKVFAWLMMLNRILTTNNLMKRGCNMVSICVMCRGDVETCKHLFSFCAFTRSLASIFLANFNFTIPDELDTLITNKNTAQKIRKIILIAHFVI
jgi:zinc-binding in reverse transcriptase